VVKISDFRSNDSVQNALKEQFGRVSRRGKKVIYLAKRTDKSPTNTEVVRLEELSKSVYAFLYEFVSFSGSTSVLFDDSATGGYVKVFGDGQAIWDRMPEDEFRLRAAIYWISTEVSSYLRQTRMTEDDIVIRSALEWKWTVVYAFSVVVRAVYGNEWKQQLSRLYHGDWTIGEGKQGEAVLSIYRGARSGVIMAYKNAQKHDKDFVHRKWMRGRNTPSEIEEVLKDPILPTIGSTIPNIPGK
jgi:hypothetical protein